MFGLGFSELLIIGIVILVFVNPKDLPKFVYHVGKIYGQLMDAYQSMSRQIRSLGDEARREIEQVKAGLTRAADAAPEAPVTPYATGEEDPNEDINVPPAAGNASKTAELSPTPAAPNPTKPARKTGQKAPSKRKRGNKTPRRKGKG